MRIPKHGSVLPLFPAIGRKGSFTGLHYCKIGPYLLFSLLRWEVAKWLRHEILILAFEGSSPSFPASFDTLQKNPLSDIIVSRASALYGNRHGR